MFGVGGLLVILLVCVCVHLCVSGRLLFYRKKEWDVDWFLCSSPKNC